MFPPLYKIFFFFVLILTGGRGILKAQDSKLDSLKLDLKNARHDTVRVIIYQYSGELLYYQNPDSALYLWQKAITLSLQNLNILNDKKSKSAMVFLNILSSSYSNSGFYYEDRAGIKKL